MQRAADGDPRPDEFLALSGASSPVSPVFGPMKGEDLKKVKKHKNRCSEMKALCGVSGGFGLFVC